MGLDSALAWSSGVVFDKYPSCWIYMMKLVMVMGLIKAESRTFLTASASLSRCEPFLILNLTL